MLTCSFSKFTSFFTIAISDMSKMFMKLTLVSCNINILCSYVHDNCHEWRLYYKCVLAFLALASIIIVSDAPSCVITYGHYSDDSRGIIYDCIMFIVQATGHFFGCHDTQHNDTQHNCTQHNNTHLNTLLGVTIKSILLNVVVQFSGLEILKIDKISLNISLTHFWKPPFTKFNSGANPIKLFTAVFYGFS